MACSALSALLLWAGSFGFAANPPAKFNNTPGQEVPSLGNTHIKELGDSHVPYNSDPPTSGPHMPGIVPWGMYERPIPKEYQVHNLEDGGVLIQYSCPKACPDLVKKLEGIFLKYKKRAESDKRYKHLVIAPYPQMDSRLALTAWTRIDKLTDYDEARIDRFIEAYIGIDHHKG